MSDVEMGQAKLNALYRLCWKIFVISTLVCALLGLLSWILNSVAGEGPAVVVFSCAIIGWLFSLIPVALVLNKINNIQKSIAVLAFAPKLDELPQFRDALAFKPAASLNASMAGSKFWGFVAIYMGFYSLQHSMLNSVLVGIGAFLLLEGMYFLYRPSPSGLLVDGFALLLLGGWNIGISFLNQSTGLFVGLGLLQLVWAVQSIWRFTISCKDWPPGHILHRIAKLSNHIKDANLSHDERIVQVSSWRIALADECAVVRQSFVKKMNFVPKGDVVISGVQEIGEKVSAEFAFGDWKISSNISQRDFERLTHWLERKE